jgi:hypothetical protein
MADEQQTTGTPTQDGGDAAVTPTTGTPEAEVRDAVSPEVDYKQLYLSNKSTVEEANRILRASREESPRASSPAGGGGFNPDAYKEYVEGIAANATDRGSLMWAQKELRSLQNEQLVERLAADNQNLQQVMGVLVQHPPETARAILTEMQANPQKYVSLDDVQRAISLRSKEQEIQKLQQDLKRLQNQNAVPTAGRETQAVPELKKEMTGSQWRARQAGLTKLQADAEAMQLRRGEVKVNWHG